MHLVDLLYKFSFDDVMNIELEEAMKLYVN